MCGRLPPVLNVLVFLAIVIFLDWQMTVMCAAMGVVAILIMRVTGRVAQHYSNQNAVEGGKLASLLIQMVQAFKYLRATAGFGAFQRRIGVSAEALQQR